VYISALEVHTIMHHINSRFMLQYTAIQNVLLAFTSLQKVVVYCMRTWQKINEKEFFKKKNR